MDAFEMLSLRFESRDLGEELTIRDYMRRLLSTLFKEGESFSGKRPFGNSGWEYDIAEPLVRAGAVRGSIRTEEGEADELEEYDEEEFQMAVSKMIACL
jgi:hypothetical protein